MRFSNTCRVLFGTMLCLTLLVPACDDDRLINTDQGTWEKHFGGTFSDVGRDIVAVPGGTFIIAGYTGGGCFGMYDAQVMRIGGNGDLLWEKCFGGPLEDYLYAVAYTGDGGVVAGGFSRLAYSEEGDAYLLKVDLRGNLLWEKRFGGNGYQVVKAVAACDNGDIVAACEHQINEEPYLTDIRIMRISPWGNLIWDKIIDGPEHSWPNGITCAPGGGFVLTGGVAGAETHCIVTKISENGEIIWSKTHHPDNAGSSGMGIATSSDGSYAIAGVSSYFDPVRGGIEYDVYLLRVNSEGDLLWQATVDYETYEYGYSVVSGGDGEVVATGYTNVQGRSSDVWLIKAAANGIVQWDRKFGDVSPDIGYSLVSCSDGGYIIAGNTMRDDLNYDVYVIKTDANGEVGE